MAVNWALGQQQGPSVGQQFQQAYEAGTTRRRQEELRNALRGYAMNPNDPNAAQQVIAVDPVMGMQIQRQQRESQQAEQQRRLEQIMPIARRARALPYENRRAYIQSVLPQLQQLGIDPRMAADFDPSDQALDAYLAYGPQEEYTLGEGQVRYRNGEVIGRGPPPRPRYYSVSHGGRLELDPSYQGPVIDQPPPAGPMPTVTTPEQAAALAPGTQFRDPQGNIRTVPGGPPVAPAGSFPGN